MSELSSSVGGGWRLINLANASRRCSFSSGATQWGNHSQFLPRGERFSSIWCGAGEGMHVAWPRQHYTFGRRRVSARSVSQSDTDMYADDWERHKGEHDWRGLRRAPRCYESTCDDGRRPEGCAERMMSSSGVLRACTVRWAVWLHEALATCFGMHWISRHVTDPWPTGFQHAVCWLHVVDHRFSLGDKRGRHAFTRLCPDTLCARLHAFRTKSLAEVTAHGMRPAHALRPLRVRGQACVQCAGQACAEALSAEPSPRVRLGRCDPMCC